MLGYLCYKKNETYEKVLDEFDAYLDEYVYEKIWHELSEQDKKVAVAIGKSESGKVEQLREILKMDSSKFSVYRNRLMKRGLIRSQSYGYLEFTLPRFDHFVRFVVEE